MPAWNNWFHVNGNTYGTWLPGDPRGWRTRHHREHVEGDYKNPPAPGLHVEHHEHSKTLLKKSPVHLSPEARRIACDEMVGALQHHNLVVAALCIDDHHYHILAKYPTPTNAIPNSVRHYTGIAKKRSAQALSKAGLVQQGGVWGIRCKITPIKDRDHQVTVVRYIVRHGGRGAEVWIACPHQFSGVSMS